jgi:hypothetical protein
MKANQAQQPVAQSAPKQKTNTFAILAIIFVFLFWPAGIIFGIIALVQIKKYPAQKGKELAIIGLTLGCVFFFSVTFLLVYLLGGNNFLNPESLLPSRCVMSDNIQCIEYHINETGEISLSLRNGLGQSISSATLTVEGECLPKAVEWPAGRMILFTCTSSPGEIGEPYKKDMSLKYALSGRAEQTTQGELYLRYE